MYKLTGTEKKSHGNVNYDMVTIVNNIVSYIRTL